MAQWLRVCPNTPFRQLSAPHDSSFQGPRAFWAPRALTQEHPHPQLKVKPFKTITSSDDREVRQRYICPSTHIKIMSYRSPPTRDATWRISCSAATVNAKQPRAQADQHVSSVQTGHILSDPHLLGFHRKKEKIHSYLCQEVCHHVNVIVGFGHLLHSVCA